MAARLGPQAQGEEAEQGEAMSTRNRHSPWFHEGRYEAECEEHDAPVKAVFRDRYGCEIDETIGEWAAKIVIWNEAR